MAARQIVLALSGRKPQKTFGSMGRLSVFRNPRIFSFGMHRPPNRQRSRFWTRHQHYRLCAPAADNHNIVAKTICRLFAGSDAELESIYLFGESFITKKREQIIICMYSLSHATATTNRCRTVALTNLVNVMRAVKRRARHGNRPYRASTQNYSCARTSTVLSSCWCR